MGTESDADRRKTDTRARILDEALRLFAERGFAGATMRAIASAVGIRSPSLYAHFDSKQAILDVLIEKTGPLAVVDVLRACRESIDVASFIRFLGDEVSKRWSAPDARMSYALLVSESFRGTLPPARSLDHMITRATAAIGERFARYMHDGTLRDDVNPERLAWELMAPIANIRVSLWGPRADAAQLARGHGLALHHVEWFIARNVIPAAPSQELTPATRATTIRRSRMIARDTGPGRNP